VGASGQDDRAGFEDVPLALILFAGQNAVAMGTPAMAHHIKTEAGRSAQVGFKCKSFFLLVDAAENPLNRKWTRPESHGDVSIFEAAGREPQTGVESITIEPTKIDNAAFTGTSRLNPAQGLGSAAAVVGGEEEVPSPQAHNGTHNVNGKKTTHRRTATPLMPMVRPRLRAGQEDSGARSRFF